MRFGFLTVVVAAIKRVGQDILRLQISGFRGLNDRKQGIGIALMRLLHLNKNNVFQVMLGNNVATAPQGFGTDIFGAVGLCRNDAKLH